jgi:hypothetical protein
MSCEENEKIVCCKKLRKRIETYNALELESEVSVALVPILCYMSCPEDCVDTNFNPDLSNQYVHVVVEDCEECLNLENICDKNLALIYNTQDCNLEEYIVSSLEEANNLESETKFLVQYYKCSSALLSESNPYLYSKILESQRTMFENCSVCCHFLNDKNETAFIKVPQSVCNIKHINNMLKFQMNIIDTKVSNTNSDCEISEYPEAKKIQDINQHFEKPNKDCGVCCLNSECLNICNINIKYINFYIKNILKYDSIIDYETLFPNKETVSAKEICAALQGKFLGYNSLCQDGKCQQTKNFIK